jgi:hypothetical protein
MTPVEIHKMLETLAEKAFPDKKILKFFIQVCTQESQSRHGDYSSMHRVIRIFNLSRKTEFILKTTIHELAHHCEYCIYGKTAHTKQFYSVYKALLETAVKMGIIDYEEVRKVNDSNDIKTLESHFGKINVAYNPKEDPKRNKYIVKVFDSFKIKHLLSKRDYTYNSIEQVWQKEINRGEMQVEKDFLYKIIEKKNVKVTGANDVQIEAIYYIIVDEGYAHKDKLYNNKYLFKGYNFTKGNLWVKKIKAKDLDKEKVFLSKLTGIKVKVKGTN